MDRSFAFEKVTFFQMIPSKRSDILVPPCVLDGGWFVLAFFRCEEAILRMGGITVDVTEILPGQAIRSSFPDASDGIIQGRFVRCNYDGNVTEQYSRRKRKDYGEEAAHVCVCKLSE